MKVRVLVLLPLVSLAACKFDDNTSTPDAALVADAARPDGSLADGGPDGAPMRDGGPALPCDPDHFRSPSKAIVLGTDFASPGTLATIDLSTQQVQKNRAVVGSDPVLRVFGECVFVINRFTDSNISVYRARDLQLIKQYSTGAGSNPHDIALVSDHKAYITRNGEKKLLIADPFTGVALGEIDLSMFDQGEAPDMESVVVAGGRAYVSIERLDSMFTPRGNGLLAVIDTATDTLVDMDPATAGVQAIPLAKQNPFGFMHLDGSKLWVPEVGDFSGSKGCLETIDTTTSTSTGCYATDTTLGGIINGFTVDANSNQAWVAVARSFTQADIVAISKVAPAAPAPFASTHNEDILDLLWAPNSFLYAADASFAAPGVRIFTASGGELTGSALDIGKPPVQGGIALAP